MIPTKIIEKAQFMELSKAEGDTMVLWKLTNVPFDPPAPEWQGKTKTRQMSLNILLMNVTEPVIYKDRDNNMAFIIINGYDPEATFTYENFRDIHIIKDAVNAWGYCLHPSYWDFDDRDDDLDDCEWRFRPEGFQGDLTMADYEKGAA